MPPGHAKAQERSERDAGTGAKTISDFSFKADPARLMDFHWRGGIVRLTSDGRIDPALAHCTPWQRTQHSTPPWRQHGSLALCFGRRGDAGY